jgi:3,4-dihydroxy 2-butanone 4-phosphate synthase/GTP cyclohydrolase II
MNVSAFKFDRAFAVANDVADVVVGPEQIIAEAAAGKMFILVDDEDRENEGDLVIPADAADAQAINFMARQGCGLICLALDGSIVDRLGLSPMNPVNGCPHQTAFTVSIEAKHGVTTGISAHDRAHTIATAIAESADSDDIISPGHVFPLRARDGGLQSRTGHTEASVDISRLAGRVPAGVICEIMNPDGTMARLDDLVVFARKHGLKIGKICDLVVFQAAQSSGKKA